MTTNDIKPCPFCGGKAKHVYFRFTDTHSVWCRNCGAESYEFDTDEEAIDAWNTRAEDDKPEPGIIACEFDSNVFGKRRCKRCGAFVSVDSVWDCFGCIPVKYCPNCGAKVVSNAD